MINSFIYSINTKWISLSKFLIQKKIKVDVFLPSSSSFLGFLPMQLRGGRESRGSDVWRASPGTHALPKAAPQGRGLERGERGQRPLGIRLSLRFCPLLLCSFGLPWLLCSLRHSAWGWVAGGFPDLVSEPPPPP